MGNPSVNVYARGHQTSQSGAKSCVLPLNMIGDRNVLTQSMINTPNTRYIIKWNYDLCENTITIPERSTLSFEGGSFYNGTVNINGADVLPNYDALADSQNLTINGYPKAGVMRWDYENEKPVWSTGEKWVNALGGDNI